MNFLKWIGEIVVLVAVSLLLAILQVEMGSRRPRVNP